MTEDLTAAIGIGVSKFDPSITRVESRLSLHREPGIPGLFLSERRG
jgi:hypothetical protein